MNDPKKETAVEPEVIKKSALYLIHASSTLTLATTDGLSAWSAPVYYVFINGEFFFFSKPDSRHIREALQTGSAGGSIHANVDTWRDIRGVQMSGSISEAQIGMSSITAMKAYLKKFPFTREFFQKDQTIDLKEFYLRFKVHFYFFKPSLVYYQDNRIKFGFRTEVDL